jgi:adenylate kinase
VKLLLLGPQGSGKGTQAKRISADYGIPQVATGEMFRAAIAEGSELGKRVEPILAAGELVPDELTIALIKERLGGEDGFVLDGFPRNLDQAEALDGLLQELGKPLDAILFFDLPEEVAIERMVRRAHEEGRADDKPDVMRRRLDVYREKTLPVVEHYRVTGKLIPLHAQRSIDEVYREVQDALEQLT